jgi:hypothetical protein
LFFISILLPIDPSKSLPVLILIKTSFLRNLLEVIFPNTVGFLWYGSILVTDLVNTNFNVTIALDWILMEAEKIFLKGAP